MTKTKNGLILIGTGILMNVMGRILMGLLRDTNGVVISGFFALWMLASAVVLLFGIFRLIMGLISRS